MAQLLQRHALVPHEALFIIIIFIIIYVSAIWHVYALLGRELFLETLQKPANAKNIRTMDSFFADAASGNLPTFSWLA